MSPEQNDNLTLEIAHVLFIDIVGYSKLRIDEQEHRLRKLQEIVVLTDEFRRAEAGGQLICLPTGDGVALTFFGDAVAPVRCAMSVSRALRPSPEIELRMGVHSGPVRRVTDINGNANVAGEGISYAQGVMEAGGGGHILLSGTVADFLRHRSGWEEHLQDLGEVEVLHGLRIHVFNLYTGECGCAYPLPKKRAPAAPLSLGPLVFKLCDRSPQVRDFAEFFVTNLKSNPGRPLLCFLHGDEQECHDSLVERLVQINVKPVAAREWGEQQGVVLFRKVRWPHEGEAGERRRELMWNLFAEFDPAYMDDDMSAAALGRLAASRHAPLVVIQHNVYGGRWDGAALALAAWYTRYLGGVETARGGPQFLVFVNVIYPKRRPAVRWKLWRAPGHADRKLIQADLRQLCEGDGPCPRLLLKELVAPAPHEVGDWFSQHDIYDAKTRAEHVERIFGGGGPVTMADIEHELQLIHQDFVRKRGAY